MEQGSKRVSRGSGHTYTAATSHVRQQGQQWEREFFRDEITE